MPISDLHPALLHALWVLPLWAVYTVGLVLVLVHWRRRRRSAVLALLALGLLAGETAGVIVISDLGFFDRVARSGLTADQMNLVFGAFSLVASSLQAAALFLLLLALFTGHRRTE
jgi:hypothetical protein